MLPEEKARVKIDKQLRNAGWDIVSRNEYLPNSTTAVKEALMVGNTESDYLLFVEGKAIAVVEAKREENPLGEEVKKQAEDYAASPQSWYALWFKKLIPLVYMANGNKIYFKNMLVPDSEYEELSQMHSPKKMLQIVDKKSEYGALPLLEKRGLRDCQYNAETKFEESLRLGNKKNLAVLATGSGKTYLACLASYRLLNYTSTKRILFLVDRNNLARQTESEFNLFDRTENQKNATAKVREKLLKDFNLHTILRLPTGIFYANGIKTNVLFFEKGKSTNGIWVYDYRTGIKHTLVAKQMNREHLQEFVDCYCVGHEQDRTPTYNLSNPNGRWRYYTSEEVKCSPNLDFKWLNFEEKDERTIDEMLYDVKSDTKEIVCGVNKITSIITNQNIDSEQPCIKMGEALEQLKGDLLNIKSKVVELGIQGKLTEQLSEEGTAEELYVTMIEEKKQLLKERKGREDKNIKELDEGVPYELPTNWKWVRFGEIGLFKKGPFGSALTKAMFVPKSDDTVKVYEQQHAIQKNSELGTYYITREYFDDKMSGFEVLPGDIIVSCAGTIGETFILPVQIEQGIINQALMRVTLVPSVNKRFFQYYFEANFKKAAQEESNGSAIKNIPPFDVMKNWYFPLPPYAEQVRIVDKIDELLSLI